MEGLGGEGVREERRERRERGERDKGIERGRGGERKAHVVCMAIAGDPYSTLFSVLYVSSTYVVLCISVSVFNESSMSLSLFFYPFTLWNS